MFVTGGFAEEKDLRRGIEVIFCVPDAERGCHENARSEQFEGATPGDAIASIHRVSHRHALSVQRCD